MYLWFIFILSDNFCTLVSLLSIKPLYFDHNFDFFDFIFLAAGSVFLWTSPDVFTKKMT